MSRSKRPEPRGGAPGGEARGKGRAGRSGRTKRERPEFEGLARGEHGVPGERAVVELLRGAPERVRRILVEEGREFAELRELAGEAGVRVETVERERHEALVGPGLARGVLALAEPPPAWALEDLLEREDGPRTRRGHRLLLVCDGIVDPHNFGAVIRSAEFFGAGAVIWARDRSAPLSPTAVRSSAGASERLPLCPVTNLARALEQAKQAHWWVIGTVVDEGQPLRELAVDPPDAMVLVLGSEARGLRRLTRERCDYLATIDGAGSLGSLNVSAAAAVALALLA